LVFAGASKGHVIPYSNFYYLMFSPGQCLVWGNLEGYRQVACT